MPIPWKITTCQLLSNSEGKPVSYTSDMNLDNANWTDVECNKVTANAGEYRIVRAVTEQNKANLTLPLTGGRAADWFTFGGIGAAALAAVLNRLLRRRKSANLD